MDDDGYDGYDDPYDGYGRYDDYDEVDEQQSRRRAATRLLGVAAAVLAVVAFGAVLLGAGDDGDEDPDEVATEDDADDTSTTKRSSTSTSSSTSTTLSGQPPPAATSGSSTTVGKGTSTTKASTTTTTATPDEPPEPRCVSGGGGAAVPVSDDWATHWQTKPNPNDAATISVCVDDVTPKVGQVVTVSLVGNDPDAEFFDAECGWLITWENDHASLCRDALVITPDPRPTPPEVPGRIRRSATHTYTAAGPATITGSVWSSAWHGYNEPYSSFAEAEIPVVVHA